MTEQNLRAKVLVRREADEGGKPWWVAQVLEYDLATQAETIDDLAYNLQLMLVAHIWSCEKEGLAPFVCLPPAPEAYHKEFKKSLGLQVELTRFHAPAHVDARGDREASSPHLLMFQQQPELEFRLCA